MMAAFLQMLMRPVEYSIHPYNNTKMLLLILELAGHYEGPSLHTRALVLESYMVTSVSPMAAARLSDILLLSAQLWLGYNLLSRQISLGIAVSSNVSPVKSTSMIARVNTWLAMDGYRIARHGAFTTRATGALASPADIDAPLFARNPRSSSSYRHAKPSHISHSSGPIHELHSDGHTNTSRPFKTFSSLLSLVHFEVSSLTRIAEKLTERSEPPDRCVHANGAVRSADVVVYENLRIGRFSVPS